MGGEMGLQSAVQQGSRFWFTLAFAHGTGSDWDDAHTPSAQDGVGHVLLINGDEAEARRQVRTLGTWANTVTTATTGARALAMLVDPPNGRPAFRIAVANEASLGMDAAQFARALQSDSAISGVSLILITDRDSNDVGERYERCGYTSILTRPFDDIYLFNAVHAASAGLNLAQTNTDVTRLVDHHLTRATPGPHTLKLLVAEDNAVNRKVIHKVLVQGGHDVTLAENGRIALERLEEEDFDACIIDMQMPELGGVDTLKLFRMTRPDRVAMPFIMLTANATTDAQDESRQAGFDAYLTKPLDPQRLLDTVQRTTRANAPPSPAHTDTAPSHLALAAARTHLDREKLSTLSKLDLSGAFLDEVINEFNDDALRLLKLMSEDLAHSRRDALAEHAHELKGAARTVGAREVTRQIEILEKQINDGARGSEQSRRATLSALQDALEITRSEFDRYLVTELKRQS
jgi:CheY-like chemotaxis protein/HPt (histidine-containing phosphotransfer) domain-containing protein